MRRLLRNKKGLDYAAMLVLVTLIVVVYMYIQLSAKVDSTGGRNIGEYPVAMLNAYQAGEDALLFVDKAAEYEAYMALDELARRGGLAGTMCGVVNEPGNAPSRSGSAVNIWVGGTNIEQCLALVQPYDAFSYLFNGKLSLQLAKYPRAQLPLDNYEIFVQDRSVTGTAIAPAVVDLKPPVETRTFYVGEIPIKEVKLAKAAIGEYAFWPSFTVSVETRLEFYEKLKAQVRALYACAETKAVEACMSASPPSFTVRRSASKPEYLIATAKNPAQSPFGQLSDIVFALYLPEAAQPSAG
jgi:hypothetical protein